MSSPLEVVIKRTSSSQQANRAIQKEAQVISQHGAKLITLERESVQKLKPLVAPVSGFLAAFTEITLMFPMEYCKVQLQLNRKNTKFSLFEHLKERKFKIYQGLPPMLIGAPLQGLLRFSSLDIITRNLQGLPPILTGVTAGIVAGTIESILVVTPMETVKTKLIDSRKGLFEGVRFIVNTQGVSGLYNGLWPTILKSASNQGIRFVVFNEYKTFILQKRQQQEKLEEAFDLKSLKSATNSISSKSGLTALQSLTGGVLAGLIGVLLNTPFDTVKSRMQGIEGARYKSTYNCAKMMITEEGFLSLYKGLLLRSARVVPGQGVIFLVYEQTNKKLTTYIDNY